MDSVAEGEAQRYFDHAITLRDTILFLRYNKDLGKEPNQVPAKGLGKQHGIFYKSRLDFRRLPGPVFDPPRRETAGRVTR